MQASRNGLKEMRLAGTPGFGTMYGNIMVKNCTEIKLGFWNMHACSKPRFLKLNTVELVLFIVPK